MSPSPTTDSKAADLRVQLDVLFAEHVFLIAKAGDAATAGRTDEYRSYATELTKSAGDLDGLVREAVGDTAGGQFSQMWSQYLDLVAGYTVGAAAHDDAKKSAAADGLDNTLAPALGQWLTDRSGIADIPATKELVGSVRAILDDEATSNWTSLYVDIDAGAGTARHIADDIGAQIVRSYPDRFPGSAEGKAFDRRLLLSAGLQQLAYIGTMASEATINSATDKATASATEIANTTVALGAGVWKSWTDDLPAYAQGTSGGSQQTLAQLASDNTALAQAFPLASPTIKAKADAQTKLEMAVIDAQKTKDVNLVASRDRASALAMQPLADALAAGAA